MRPTSLCNKQHNATNIMNDKFHKASNIIFSFVKNKHLSGGQVQSFCQLILMRLGQNIYFSYPPLDKLTHLFILSYSGQVRSFVYFSFVYLILQWLVQIILLSYPPVVNPFPHGMFQTKVIYDLACSEPYSLSSLNSKNLKKICKCLKRSW